MTQFDRRSFVAALAASLTSATTVQASGEPTMPEHPDLLAMSDQIPDALQAYKDAAARVRSIVQTWGPQWPEPDPDIIWYGSGCETHRNIRGVGIEVPWGTSGETRIQQLGTPEGYKMRYDQHMREAARRSKLKSKRGMKRELDWAERMQACIEPARAYWSEAERIETESGIKAAKKAEALSIKALCGLVGQVLTFEEQSPIGLAIKAQALAAFIGLPPFWQACNPGAPQWLAGLTATLARQADAT